MFKRLRLFIHQTRIYYSEINKIQNLLAHLVIKETRTDPRYASKQSLVPHGRKIYSQNDEDGIIREIFNRIGLTNKIFVEFGIGDGLENNTLALMFDDWKGLWIDGSKKFTTQIKKEYIQLIDSGQLSLVNEFVTKDNIDKIISQHIDEKQIDLLSIDIDGNDCHVFESIKCIDPRVIVIEYNPKFPPPVNYCMEYDPAFEFNRDDNTGASLVYLESRFTEKGYSLVGCNLTGANAFFVKNELLGDLFQQPYTAEFHYEPARHYITWPASGHPASYKTLPKSLKRNE